MTMLDKFLADFDKRASNGLVLVDATIVVGVLLFALAVFT